MDLVTTFFCSVYFLLCFLINIATRGYVIAVNGSAFVDNFFCSVYFLLCFLINFAIWDCVIAVKGK